MSRALKDYNSVDWSSLFIYDPTIPTGLRWKVDRMSGRWMAIKAATAGTPAGNIAKDTTKNTEYCNVPHNGCNWAAHRVVWILNNGYLDSDYVIDHIDGNTLNNNIDNLRVVEQLLNNRNASKRKDNNTGISGVHFTTAKGVGDRIYTYTTASWYSESNVKKSKHFAVSKYGLLPAFAMACQYREDKIKELNEQGYGYSENHGK